MTARGIPVFNTPGANANSVKELVLCGLLLSSRGIIEGIAHTKDKIVPEEGEHKAIAARIEKDKKHFAGQELLGKTLAVCGLGNIGAMVAEAGIALGMNVIGYDPKISVQAAWRLPNSVTKMDSLEAAFERADYVSINMPYIKDATHHAINESVLSKMHPKCNILNMARGEIVDGAALKKMYDNGHQGKYLCDFADEAMQHHPNFICIPHLGASTEEAEDNCAEMAAKQMIDYLETGTIKNSVNFPAAQLDRQDSQCSRLCVINKNVPGALGEITTLLGSAGVNITQQVRVQDRDSKLNCHQAQAQARAQHPCAYRHCARPRIPTFSTSRTLCCRLSQKDFSHEAARCTHLATTLMALARMPALLCLASFVSPIRYACCSSTPLATRSRTT